MRIGLSAQRVVDRGERKAKSHEGSDGEDLTVIEPQLELFRTAGAFAAELPVPPDATPQTRFLAMLGRGL